MKNNREITTNTKDKETAKESTLTKKDRIISEASGWAIIIGIALILATLINEFILLKAKVISGSMLDTMRVDDEYLGDRLSYVFGDPERGEIVFFKYPDNEKETFVKRIIGLPGEKLEVRKGKIYINDSPEPLVEPYLKETPKKDNFGPVIIPDDCYFMMGDNRNHSSDSRAWDTFYVKREQILAKAWLRIWPLFSFSLVEHHDYNNPG